MIGSIAALAAIAVFVGSGMAAAGAEDELSDNAKLAQDRMAIEEALRRYVRALDDSDLDAFLATLTDDAKFVSAEGSYAGKEAIRKYVEPVMWTPPMADWASDLAAAFNILLPWISLI